jgi:NADPH:quinone reductase-like Zn-dependent oxidoreductase/aryl carrier-like protein
VIISDGSEPVEQVAAKLAAEACPTVVVTIGTQNRRVAADRWEVQADSPEAWRDLFREISRPESNLVWFATADSAQGVSPVVQRSLRTFSALCQALVDRGATVSQRLCVVTRGVEPVELSGCPLNLSSAAMKGYLRSLAHEKPLLHVSSIDLGHWSASHDVEAIAGELLHDDGEAAVAHRGSRRYVERLTTLDHRSDFETSLLQPSGESRLAMKRRGSFDQMQLEPITARSPGPDEVRIQVESAGLNFRDVLNAMGLYPGQAGELGMECAGRVAEIGSEVTQFAVGDEVVALAQGGLATTVVTSAELVCRRPPCISSAEAAASPVVFVTAAFALRHLARLQPGERVLIHVAAGGVGWAAVQIARQLGAEVFATASRDKWAYLQSQGIENIYDSRSLAFAEQIRTDTAGRGVDVVVNSLAGDFISASLATLTPSGRFVELGKQGIWSAEEVNRLHPGVAYHIFALDRLMQSTPREVGQVLREVCRDFEVGVLEPPPLACYAMTAARDAFQSMQKARHVGKLVIQVPPQRDAAIRPDATYLVVGGAGGLGTTVVSWLLDHGAKSIALVGRRPADAGIHDLIAMAAATDVKIVYFSADVADESALRRMFDECRESLPPMRGVFQLAGVLDDGFITNQSWPQMQRVFAPKINGTWNLHRLTLRMPLDYFVLFSSCTAWLGSAGQTAYAAANVWLEALILERRRQGLPGVAIAWGPWSQRGMMAGLDNNLRKHWAERGFQFIDPDRGSALLNHALASAAPRVGAFRVDWNAYRESAPQAGLLVDVESDGSCGMMPTIDPAPQVSRDSYLDVPLERRQNWFDRFVREQVRAVLGMPPNRVLEQRVPLVDLGLDSLLSVELVHRLRSALSPPLQLPSNLLTEHPTLAEVVDCLTTRGNEVGSAP